ncbi:hypothetical protein A8C56_21340 [Niabella ginsenosidivorans]|uniref:YD repeat-containing protein n=1 Tax=Niabella ginsenosidivorans TaxID=1176587 RepID=A0A1A9I766_9BACT|nr:hypothetical protein [Niabella ginsenosidivorans]ANH83185.1 hypothetical protein A8C56_21340 [Niabella ginsenosidivorans]
MNSLIILLFLLNSKAFCQAGAGSGTPIPNYTDFDENTLQIILSPLRNIANAVTTTYTYMPFIGVSSKTVPTGTITFYEYDGFERLFFVKDEKGNILKKISYNYASQVVNCYQ